MKKSIEDLRHLPGVKQEENVASALSVPGTIIFIIGFIIMLGTVILMSSFNILLPAITCIFGLILFEAGDHYEKILVELYQKVDPHRIKRSRHALRLRIFTKILVLSALSTIPFAWILYPPLVIPSLFLSALFILCYILQSIYIDKKLGLRK